MTVAAFDRWNPNRWEKWQRNQWAIYAGVFISFLSFTFVMPFLPQYVQQLGVTDPARAALWSGVLFGVSPLLGGLLTPFWARVAERTGNKPMVMRSLIAFVFIMAAMPLCQNVWQLLALRVLLGVFAGFSSFAVAVISVTVPQERVSQSIGTLQSVQFVAAAAGPLIGGGLADTFGLRSSFLVAAAINILACAIFLWLFDATHDRAIAPKRRERASFAALGRIPGFLAVMVTLFFVNFAERSFGPLIPLYVQQLHAPEQFLGTISGAVITSGSLIAAIAAIATGRLSRRYDPRTLLLIALAGGGLLLVPVALAQEWWHLLVLRPLLSVFIGGNITLTYAIAARALPQEWKLTAFGALGGLSMLGGAAAPFAAGIVTDLTDSLRTIFAIDAVLYGLLLVWVWRSVRLPADATPPVAVGASAPAHGDD